MPKSSRDKKMKALLHPSGEGRGGPPLCDPGPELNSTGRERESSARVINGMNGKKKKVRSSENS